MYQQRLVFVAVKTDCASIGNKLCEIAGYICQDTPNGAVCVEGELLTLIVRAHCTRAGFVFDRGC